MPKKGEKGRNGRTKERDYRRGWLMDHPKELTMEEAMAKFHVGDGTLRRDEEQLRMQLVTRSGGGSTVERYLASLSDSSGAAYTTAFLRPWAPPMEAEHG